MLVDARPENTLAETTLKPQPCSVRPSSALTAVSTPPPVPPNAVQKKATKAAEAAALHRLRAMTNASARVLSASWFSLLARAPGGAAARGGGHGHGHGHDGSADEHAGSGAEGAVSIDATVVPVIAVRRLIQSCGILGTTGGAPTLGYADMELQRNAVGKGGRSIGHREVRMGCGWRSESKAQVGLSLFSPSRLIRYTQRSRSHHLTLTALSPIHIFFHLSTYVKPHRSFGSTSRSFLRCQSTGLSASQKTRLSRTFLTCCARNNRLQARPRASRIGRYRLSTGRALARRKAHAQARDHVLRFR